MNLMNFQQFSISFSYLLTADEFVAIWFYLKYNYISEAPPKVALFIATAQRLLYGSQFLVYREELSLFVHPIHLYKCDNYSFMYPDPN